MKRVDIISKVVGRDSSGKPIGGGVSIPMGNYALKSDFELLKSMFNDFLEGDDTDSVINRWKDLEEFLNGVSEEDTLTSILGNYVTIKGYTEITGEKNFVGGLKVNGSPIYYDKDKKYWKLEGDLLVTGGVTMYGSDSEFVASTIMDAIAVDGTTISKDGGILKVIGGTGGGGISSVTSQMIVDALGYTPASATALSGYLPLSGGTITNNSAVPLTINANNDGQVGLFLQSKENNKTYVGWDSSRGTCLYEFASDSSLNILNGVPRFNTNTIWHSGNDGSGSGLDADLLDGVHLTKTYSSVSQIDFSSIMWKASGAIGETGFGSLGYAALLNVGDNISRGWQVWNSRNDHRLYWRAAKVDLSGWGDIHVIIDNYNIKDYNAGSATKLQTARTIWGQSFDGTADVSGSIYFDSGIIGTYQTVKANEFTSIVAWKNTINSMIGYVGYYSDHFIFANVANNTKENCAISAYDDGKIIFRGGNVGIGTGNPSRLLDVAGNASVQALKISATSSTYHIEFSRDGANYLYAPSGGYIRFVTNGKNLSSSNADMIISDSSVTVQGNLLTTGGFTMYSDSRKKTILNHVELSLQQVANAPLIEHYYNSDQNKTTHVGSIAQYWAEMNDWFCKLDNEGYYTMEIQNAALASAISVARELVNFETETDRRIRLLEEENKRLKEEVEQLKWNIA